MSKPIKATEENIHDLIDEWHQSDSNVELHQHLGMTFEEYAYWVKTDKFMQTEKQ